MQFGPNANTQRGSRPIRMGENMVQHHPLQSVRITAVSVMYRKYCTSYLLQHLASLPWFGGKVRGSAGRSERITGSWANRTESEMRLVHFPTQDHSAIRSRRHCRNCSLLMPKPPSPVLHSRFMYSISYGVTASSAIDTSVIVPSTVVEKVTTGVQLAHRRYRLNRLNRLHG
jgi:hypothetical protein